MTLEEAIIIATNAHKGQKDRLGKPYILHCLHVMQACSSNIDAMIVGVLHDVVEDTDYKISAEDLGYKNHLALGLLTRRKSDTYEDYIERICSAPADCGGDIARRVKLADLSHNISRNHLMKRGPKQEMLKARYETARDCIRRAGTDI